MSDAILNVEHLCKSFSKDGERIEAVRDVSFELRCGECVGLIGESGSGKSTVANLIAGLETADGGRIIMNGTDLLDRKDRAGVHACRSKLQMIFQNPRLSFNPAMTIGQGVEEALKYFQRIPAKQRHEMMLERLRQVGLPEAYADKKASQLSGGECQRAAIARALMANPDLLLCDEITSALDVSVQAQVMALLMDVRRTGDMSMLFISHNLNVVRKLCDRVAVMQRGVLVEEGLTRDVYTNPQHDYTKHLIAAIPRRDRREET
jgi:ABC-type glutathione transport system ATPase component